MARRRPKTETPAKHSCFERRAGTGLYCRSKAADRRACCDPLISHCPKPPIRLAAMMKLRVIYVFIHDSIALGQDGSTHQPVEQLAGLRAVPGLTVIRPGDANETTVA